MTDVVGVVGCGTMGAGIAEACARAEHRVLVWVRDDDRAGAGRRRIEESLDRAVESRRIEAAGRGGALARIGFVTDVGSLGEAGIVVEAVPELLDAKREVFRALGAACPGAILATNTSSLPVVELAAASGHADRVVGLHFFNPAPAMPLVELAVTVATDPGVRDAAAAFARSLDKTVVVCRDRAGFIANLLLFPYLNEAVRLLDAGAATRDDIDTAMRLGAGHPMGPLELVDLIGLDACEQILQSLHRQFAEPRFAPAPALRELVAAGFTGRKVGRGFYDHAGADDPERPGASRPAVAPGDVEVATLGLVGTGTVASGLAEAAAAAGLPVVGLGRSSGSCERARAAVEGSTARSVEKGRLEPGAREEALARIRWTTEPTDLAGCGFVVEAVAEDLAAKREVFATLDAVADVDAVLATATSSLPVVRLAAATRRADRVLGFHVFNPVPSMRLVELVRTVATSDDAVAVAEAVAGRLGKTVVHCRDRAGFIVNRLLFPYLNDAARMVEEGYASVEDVDTVMTLGCRHPLGPMRLMDLVGLDVTVEILRSLQAEHLDPAYAPVPLLEEMVAAGFLGRKSGRGFATR
jgi:3-hydroxybutyryl-CoA dehydrogenase